jgi:hypothetical protein
VDKDAACLIAGQDQLHAELREFLPELERLASLERLPTRREWNLAQAGLFALSADLLQEKLLAESPD